MTETTMGWDILENDFAMAVSSGADGEYIKKNGTFTTMFPGVVNADQLDRLVISKTENKTVLKHENGYWELLRLKTDPGHSLHLLKNISYEMLILQKLKEQLKELNTANHKYSEILSRQLPVGVMVIDKDFNVSFVNNMMKRLFHLPPRAKLPKCYNHVREIKRCPDCLLKNFTANHRKRKKTFTVDGEMITAEIHPLEEEFILIFRDTTREINMIREIKVQQENLEKANQRIAEQNDILKRLSNINIRIGQLKDPAAILEAVIDSITETFHCRKGAILLYSPVGHIEGAHFTKDFTRKERDGIIESIVNPGMDGEPALKHFIVQEMSTGGRGLGKVFLHRPGKAVDPSILQLFLSQVSIFLENLKLQQKLEELAQTDSLTGVFNRYYFDKQWEKEKELSLRFGQPLSLVIVDVNGLKEANDVIGHEAGDLLLQGTPGVLQRCIGAADSVYRIGGDEFVVLMPNCPEHRLRPILDRMKEEQAAAEVRFKDTPIPVRFSLGGACSENTDHERLKATADKRMYEDKDAYYEINPRYR